MLTSPVSVCDPALSHAVAVLSRHGHPRLTARELDCLRWVAIGKTRIEVGMILGLAPRTVNHHLTTACMKLDVINTHAAVTRLILLGMLQAASSGPPAQGPRAG